MKCRQILPLRHRNPSDLGSWGSGRAWGVFPDLSPRKWKIRESSDLIGPFPEVRGFPSRPAGFKKFDDFRWNIKMKSRWEFCASQSEARKATRVGSNHPKPKSAPAVFRWTPGMNQIFTLFFETYLAQISLRRRFRALYYNLYENKCILQRGWKICFMENTVSE